MYPGLRGGVVVTYYYVPFFRFRGTDKDTITIGLNAKGEDE